MINVIQDYLLIQNSAVFINLKQLSHKFIPVLYFRSWEFYQYFNFTNCKSSNQHNIYSLTTDHKISISSDTSTSNCSPASNLHITIKSIKSHYPFNSRILDSCPFSFLLYLCLLKEILQYNNTIKNFLIIFSQTKSHWLWIIIIRSHAYVSNTDHTLSGERKR